MSPTLRTLCILACLGLCLKAAPHVKAAPADNPRSEVPLETGWKFAKGAQTHAGETNFDDAAWEGIRIPHTWNARDGQQGGPYFMGDGWYRRHLSVPDSWTGRRVYLQFDGANRVTEVFLNGQRVGEHRGGFARFRFDVTRILKVGGDNLLAVRVNNADNEEIAPIQGDFTMFGGLYRTVSLLATDEVQIETLDRASTGVFIKQLHVSGEKAELEVVTELRNWARTGCTARVSVSVLDAGGRIVARAEKDCSLAAGDKGASVLPLVLDKPRLWDGRRAPNLYVARVELLVDGKLRDCVEQPFGVRSYQVDAAKGFTLNGHTYDLHGANRHQDRWNLGWAIGRKEEEEDMALMMEMGCTMDRVCHYQQNQSWYDLADKTGMILWTEVPFINDVKNTPAFFESAKEQLRELIRQNYNHPSVLFWGIGNETFVRTPKTIPPDTNDRLITELAAVAREEDPLRLSTYASNGDILEPKASLSDTVGFNHYFGWYDGEPADFELWLDKQHQLRPQIKLGMSEYGAGANVAQHELPARHPKTTGQWHPEEWQSHFHEVYWQTLEKRPWVWCKLVWCMFDFASAGRNEGGTPGRNDKGLVTADRQLKKDAFFYYKANWSEEPVLYITSRRFVLRSEALTPVKVYSNSDTVELWLNGKSLGCVKAENHIFEWNDVRLENGENRVVVTATAKGKRLEDSCTWVYAP